MEARDRLVKCEIPVTVFSVLWGGAYEASHLLEDRTINNLTPASILYRPLRQRIYGFMQIEERVLEWCAYATNHLKQPEQIEPTPLEGLFSNKLVTLIGAENIFFPLVRKICPKITPRSRSPDSFIIPPRPIMYE